MTPANRIYVINLLALLAQALVLRLVNARSANGEDGIGFAIMLALGIGVQLLINAALAAVTGNSAQRPAYLISLLLVLLIGFGVCAGGLSTY